MTLEALANSATLNMVQCQLAPNGVRNESVLEAFLSLDRAMYLPPALKAFANIDDNVGDKEGTVLLMRPVALGLMVQYLSDTVKSGTVAIIGDASGYSADLLATLNFTPTQVQDEQQLRQEGKWNAILINGCLPASPDYLFTHLAEGGAVLTIIRAENSGVGDIVAISADKSITLGQGSAPFLKSLTPPPAFAL